jgi:serine protease Do
MNTAINPAGQGIGFAIPSDEIRQVLPQLVTAGHVERARLGVHVQDVDQNLAAALNLGDAHGALVGDIEKGSPAEKAGLANGDVVIRAGDVPITHARDLSRTIAHQTPGSKVDLVLRRGSDTKTVAVTLAKLEEDAQEKTSSRETTPSGRLGVEVGDADGGGAIVRRVAPDGPAAGALQPGDVVTEVNRKPVTSANDLRTRVHETPSDRPVLLQVKRGGSSRYVAIERG